MFPRLLAPIIFLTFQAVAGAGLKSEQEARYLSFSVRNSNGIYVRDLKLKEVTLRLDGKEMPLRFLGSTDVETAFVVLVENGPRTAKFSVSLPQWGQINVVDRYRYLLLDDFFRPITNLGGVLLGEFFRDVKVLQDFTSSEDLLAGAIHAMEPNFTFIDMDKTEVGRALGRGVDLLRDRPEKRKALVILTTSIDPNSYKNLEEYQLMFRNTSIDLFVVSYAASFPTDVSHTFFEKMNRFFFQSLGEETAGQVFITGDFVRLDTLFTELKGRLENSYTIGFYVEPGRTVEEHRVELATSRPKCEVTSRKFLVF